MICSCVDTTHAREREEGMIVVLSVLTQPPPWREGYGD